MNHVTLVGRFAGDPELTYTESGKAKAIFAIAINSGFGEKRTTDFIDCEAWEKAAEKIAEQGRKGREISIGGRISVQKWQDKETGKNRKTVRVVANTVVIGPEPARVGPPQRPQLVEQPEVEVDDIPF